MRNRRLAAAAMAAAATLTLVACGTSSSGGAGSSAASTAVALGGPPECPQRPYCEPGLEKTYGIKFSGFTSLDSGGPLTKKALQQGKIQVGLVFSSDGGIEALGLKVLEDDKHLQNVDAIVAVVNKNVMADPLSKALNGVAAALTTDELISLNKKVDIDGDDPDKVANDWLTSKGLLTPSSGG
jgi:osmoprotectant transport system substrate-binding protein